MSGNLTLEALRQEVAAGSIDTVNVVFIDMQGRLMGKRFHAEYFLEAYEETHACNYLLTVDIDMEPVPGYAAASWEQGYGDFVLKPDLATLRRVAWLPGTAMVVCDVQNHHHHDIPHSPRAILKKQLARLEAKGWKAFMASELEFYLFNESYQSAGEKRWRQLKTFTSYIEDYGILPTTYEEPFMREIRTKLAASGVRIENSKGEWGPGQEEINVRYSDPLTMADEHAIMKTGIKEMAHLQGKAVTFMSKYAYDLAGSSCHVHQSLWDANGPLFLDKGETRTMSKLMRHYLAGLLHHSQEITYFLAPYINSYKRFQVGTFAPTKAIWSADNRTAGFRVVGEESKGIRVECRMGGADINPHLAFAAMLAAGLSGIENEMELEPEFSGDAYNTDGIRHIPKTLREAIETLKGSEMLKKAFGADVIEHYVHTAEWEQFEYDRRITDWELQRGFERY
ncbi:glutamine synthetase family protein [Oryzibacter oryziterrae]|uniref:glutamine synthetase family protein n=1 Tax=Oryzibacter oryziterrae TaxID=2766474 RepID=UPI001F42207C|nr:glutamine synthetase family protein [Oryzibacter oryziterrae]